ncbi:hypothetical protein ACTI_66480 [Actinoplanes sp. OR16]|nr:hypothetical protein ACTI_66480 [Actinoplanes sp. OR16]
MLGRDREAQIREAGEHTAHGDPRLEAGQGRAQAEVDAVPERQMPGVVAAGVEGVRVTEPVRVAVDRRQRDQHLLHHGGQPVRVAVFRVPAE